MYPGDSFSSLIKSWLYSLVGAFLSWKLEPLNLLGHEGGRQKNNSRAKNRNTSKLLCIIGVISTFTS